MNDLAMNRRSFGALLMVASGAALGAGGLAGCSTSSPPADAAKRSPSAGRTVRVVAPEATQSLGLDPRRTGFGVSMLVVNHLYAPLVERVGSRYRMGVAESVRPNGDATEWVVRVRDGLRFHDGRPITADDVIASLRAMGTAPSNRISTYRSVALDKLEATDRRTVRIPLRAPRGDFIEDVLAVLSPVFPAGTSSFDRPVGSGPYRFDSVDRGRVRLTAVQAGGNLPQTLELVKMDDPAARLRALRSGEADYAVSLGATGAATLQSSPGGLTLRQGTAEDSSVLSFSMNESTAPFDDPRVRQAVRLVADRARMVQVALRGMGEVGNDLVGLGLPGYAAPPQRSRDVAKARQLFSAAGVDALTLRTGEIFPGVLAATDILKQNLAEAGVRLTVQNVPPEQYYADLKGLSRHPFQAFFYENRPASLHLSQTTIPGAPFNVTGQGAAHAKQLAAAQAVVDAGRRHEAFAAIQKRFHESGGDLIWGYAHNLDGARPEYASVPVRHAVPAFGA